MNIINNNPYRQLGVYITSSQKDVVSNIGKMKAFLKVGRPVSFGLDLVDILPPVCRTEQSVADANSNLALPVEQLKYAQFWFAKCTQFDEIACGKLINGDIDKAVEIWNKKETVSSLQNLLVCSLIRNQIGNAIRFAETLYSKYGGDFVKMVLGDNALATSQNLALDFIEALCEEFNPSQILGHISNSTWRVLVLEMCTKPLIEKISLAIDSSKKSKGQIAKVRYTTGCNLMNNTKQDLAQLEQYVSITDLQYQMVADKLGLEILQCGIDYYNGSDEDDAAYKAMKLQRYAQSIVVGKLAKDRCDENVRILDDIISKLPPIELMSHHKAIHSYIADFAVKPNLIQYSIQLIKECVPHIAAIKDKLGKAHRYYLEISTTVVNLALGNLISEVNAAQKKDFDVLKSTLISAWLTQLYLDKFDLEFEFKNGRFKQCRETLYDIISNVKGFESPAMSSLYRYGCGWCLDLDTSDVDLRTDDEYYSSCKNLNSYLAYLSRFPNGKHVHEAKSKIIDLRYKKCKTIQDYQKFIVDFPNSNLREQAQKEINRLYQEEAERKARIEKQENSINSCQSTDEVISLYNIEKTNQIDKEKCSKKAFDLAKGEGDFRRVIAVFGTLTKGGKNAKSAIDKIESDRKEALENRKKVLRWSLVIIVLLIIVGGIYLLWGADGLSTVCYVLAFIFGSVAFAGIRSMEAFGCLIGFVCGILAVLFGIAGEELNKIAKEDKITSHSTVQSYSHKSEQNNNSKYDNTSSVTSSTKTEVVKTQAEIDYETYKDNQLETGSKPYNNYYKSRAGDNYLDFRTSGNDFVIIVRDYVSTKVVNHIYVRANDKGRLYLPDGIFNIYFYGGTGWNPNMKNGKVVGGFVSGGHVQKDGPVELYNQYGEYTLYPVKNGNLQLKGASTSEAL